MEEIKKTKLSVSDIVYSKSVIEFVAVSNEFCKFIENVTQFEKKTFVEKSLKFASLLYTKTIALPEFEISEGEGVEKFVSEADWHFIDQNISTKLGEDEVFTDLSEPANLAEITNTSLSECFADIYQDIKDFTMLYQLGNEQSILEGLWECKQNFEQIWGPRVIVIMKELHNLLYSEKELEDDLKPAVGESITGQSNWVHEMFNPKNS